MKSQKTSYEYDQRKYFDWAKGIRATDKYHTVAEECHARIRELHDMKKIGAIAEEGYAMAEDTRKKIAKLMHTEPKCIYFANSATFAALTAMTGLMSIFNGNRLNIRYSDHHQYPTTALPLYYIDNLDGMQHILTRQNYGYRSISLTQFFSSYFAKLANGYDWKNMKANSFAKTFSVPKYTGDDTYLTICMFEQADRYTSRIYFPNYRTFQILSPGVDQDDLRNAVIIDASHSFGQIDSEYQTLYCDAIIASSSKALGAEPTLGIGYGNSRIFSSISHAIGTSALPRIAFQFSPDSGLGMGMDEIIKSEFWISLPELASLNAAITDLLKEGVDKRNRRLLHIKKRIIESLKHLVPKAIHNLSAIKARNSDIDMTYQRTKMAEAYDLLNRPDHFLCESDYLALQVLPNTVVWEIPSFYCMEAQSILNSLDEKGYVVGNPYKTASVISTIHNARQDSCVENAIALRITFRSDVEQDVDGFMQLLGDIIERKGR